MKRWTTGALVGTLLVAALAVSAVAADSQQKAQRPWQRLVARLNLTQTQQKEIRPLFRAHRQDMRQRNEAFKSELESMLTADQMSKLEQLRADRKAARQAGQPVRRAAFKSLDLTQEQQAQLKDYVRQNRPQRRAATRQYAAQVRALLTDEQKSIFDQMTAPRGRPATQARANLPQADNE